MYDYCTKKTTVLYNKPKKMKVSNSFSGEIIDESKQ